MTKITTTVRVYPEDAPVLEAVRQWLQKQYGTDHTLADAVNYALLNLQKTNPSISEMLAK